MINLVFIALAFSSYGFAQMDYSSTTLSESMRDIVPTEGKDIYDPRGFWPLIGIGVGYMGQTESIRTEGVPTHLKFLGSYYAEGPWVAEIGGGLYNQVFLQSGGGADTLQALELETSTRYILPERWSIGPVWSTLTGNDRFSSNTKNWTSFFGVQVKRDIAWDNEYLVRMGGRFMTDVGVSGEQINSAMFEVEIGLGEGSRQVSQPIVIEEDRSIASHLANQAFSGPLIFDGPMNFIENQPTMISSADKRAERLARALANNSHLFERIEIIGHADERGPDNFNQKLSERRAQNLAHKFRRAGLTSNRMIVEGRGSREPIAFNNSETSWFKNRRVEVKLIGVKDQAALSSILRSIN